MIMRFEEFYDAQTLLTVIVGDNALCEAIKKQPQQLNEIRELFVQLNLKRQRQGTNG